MLYVTCIALFALQSGMIKKAPRSLLERYTNQLATLVTGDQHSDCFLYPTCGGEFHTSSE